MNSHKRPHSRQHRRTELYLVRVWIDATEGIVEGEESAGKPPCRGRVQRVVDGESYSFDDWQGLTDLLLALLSGSTPNISPAGSQNDTSQ